MAAAVKPKRLNRATPAGPNHGRIKASLLAHRQCIAYNAHMNAVQECCIEAGGIRTRYLRAGERGTALVLVHGLGASADIWKDNLLPLAAAHRVFAPDLVGFGRTDKPDINYNPRDFVLFLDAFLDATGLEKARLVGLSLGGGIALAYTLEFPQRVDKLVLVDSAGLGPEMTLMMRLGSIPILSRWIKVSKPLMGSLVRRLVHDPAIVTEGLVNLFYGMLSAPGSMRTVSRVLNSVATLSGAREEVLVPIAQRLHTIDVPTLIVWGREDRIIPVKHGIEGTRRIPGSRLHIFDRCGHLPNIEKSEEFNRLVLEFLNNV